MTKDRAQRRGQHRSILDRAFLRPDKSQEQVAFALGIPYGTFRRRVREASDRLADALWSRRDGAGDERS